MILKGARWNVISTDSINPWTDPWAPLHSDFKIQSPRPPNSNVYWVRDLIDRQRSQWKMDVLRSMFDEAECKAILCIPIQSSSQRGRDSIVWHFEKSGSYAVRSAYRLLKSTLPSSSSSSSLNQQCWKLAWPLHTPPKISCMRNALPTGENLS